MADQISGERADSRPAELGRLEASRRLCHNKINTVLML